MSQTTLSDDERHDITREFRKIVNMAPSALRHWLDTEESRSVGMTESGEKVHAPDGKEAVGHHMGEVVLQVREKKASDLDDEDYHAMNKVIGYVHRHMAQQPKGDISDTRWRKSLMNWGHDPLKS